MSDFASDAQYDRIISVAIAGAAAAGPLIIVAPPMADLVVVGKHWTAMAIEIARMNGVSLEKKSVAKIMTAVAAGVGAYVGAVKLFNFVISKVPGIGMAAGAGVNSGVNVLLTLWLAFALIDLFSKEGKKEKFEDYAGFLLEELKPSLNKKKIQRAIAFAKRVAKRK